MMGRYQKDHGRIPEGDEGTSFWVIWNPTHGLPKVRHQFESSARSEATRLARENPGQQFFMLEAVEVIEATGVARKQLERTVPF
jgi:hypothetical protein